MKNLLVLTDFSDKAKQAAEYAYALAKMINADLILCNAVIVPAEMPQAGMISWPMEESSVLEKDSHKELEKLKKHLLRAHAIESKAPKITTVCKSGYLQDVAESIISNHQIAFVVMSTHKAGFSGLLLGNHSRNMINYLHIPVILIPNIAPTWPVKKIFFASDFSNTHGDIGFLRKLVPFAELLNAEICIVHISNAKKLTSEEDEQIKSMMLQVKGDFDYPNIHFSSIANPDEANALTQLVDNDVSSLLVLIHRSKSFFGRLMSGSLSQKLTKEIKCPLLIFKEAPQPKHLA